MFEEKSIKLEVGGKEVTVETGKLARQATGSVVIKCLDTVLLVTVTRSGIRDGIDFFPLMVDFEEKHYSVGRIPGGFLKREGRASDKAVLVSRLIDRPVRPLFPAGYKNDVQINVMTLSTDENCPPDTLAMLGAAFALEVSGVPFDGPFGAVRVSLDANGEFEVNPSEADQITSDLDIVVAGTADSIMMVEAGANFVEDTKVVDAIAFAHEEIKKQVAKIAEFGQICGVVREEFEAEPPCVELQELIAKVATDDLKASMQNATKASRKEFQTKIKENIDDAIAELLDKDEDNVILDYLDTHPNAVGEELKNCEKKLLRAQILDTKVRADGRKPDEVRQIYIEAGNYPRVHGAGLFTRGDTQVLSIAALGTEREAKMLDGIDSETEKFYMHNYNFPGWSVGEVKPNRGPGRREVGHGALAERAVLPSLPSREEFPYAIRVVSEVLSSSGSTSMGATCGSSLALMDAGVPVKCPVSGVAMGLITEGEDRNVILTDIHELEDFLGDMDFKVAGNAEGISALQMDIKVKGISMDTIRGAIAQAKDGRLHIMNKMTEVIPEARDDLRGSAPRVITCTVDQDKIGAVIGPSGKNIKWVIEVTGTDVNINDDGLVCVYTNDKEAGELAKKYVLTLANGAQAGDVWEGEVVKVLEGVGAIIELIPGCSGLVHISQLAHERVENVEDIVKMGERVTVKVQGTDFKGRTSLSIKALTEAPKKEKKEETEEAPAA